MLPSDRADAIERASVILEAYSMYVGRENEGNIRKMLLDLMCYCEQKIISFELELREAEISFSDGIDQREE